MTCLLIIYYLQSKKFLGRRFYKNGMLRFCFVLFCFFFGVSGDGLPIDHYNFKLVVGYLNVNFTKVGIVCHNLIYKTRIPRNLLCDFFYDFQWRICRGPYPTSYFKTKSEILRYVFESNTPPPPPQLSPPLLEGLHRPLFYFHLNTVQGFFHVI